MFAGRRYGAKAQKDGPRHFPRAVAVLAGIAMMAPMPGALPSAVAVENPAGSTPGQSGLALWYDEPATDWETQSLPIGNGHMGASIFGGIEDERLTLNQKTLWTGGPGSTDGWNAGNYEQPRPGALAEVRAKIAADGSADPDWVSQKLGHPRKGYGSYQPLGDLRLRQSHEGGSVSNYSRSLDVATAVAEVKFTAGGVSYTRQYFTSAADGVMVARLSASEPGKISLQTALEMPDNRTAARTTTDGLLTVKGALTQNGLKYETQIKVLNEGGTRTDGSDAVTVAGADAVTVIVAAGTDYADSYPAYRGPDPHAAVTAQASAAADKTFDALRSGHLADYKGLFDRVALDLRTDMPDLPTDELLASYQNGSAQPAARRALEALFFQYGRYLLISSSRGGSLPANLQGIWNNSPDAPWGSDYHPNINLQMNYWPAEQTNLAETAEPLFDFIDGLQEPGNESVKSIFDTNRGFIINNEANPFGFTGVGDWATAFWYPEAAAWLAQHYYDSYKFSQDADFLSERAYPVMKSLAGFWMDNLVTDARDGSLVVSPSYSPEQGQFTAGAAMSQQIVGELLRNTVAAATLVGDTSFIAEVNPVLAKLDPGLRVGSWGQLQEWKADLDDPNNQHRHVSHLFALHPGNSISPLTTPELAAAAKVSLEARGDGGTGWSKAWKINFWARLLDGDHAHKMLSEQLKNSTLTNLWDNHPPFQIDGNFGATSGVTEMLLQSQNNEIHVLPALPSDWAEGSVAGLRARGDATVGVSWAGGGAQTITVEAGHTGSLKLRNTMFTGPFKAVDQASGQAVAVTVDNGTASFAAQAGHKYSFAGDATLAVDAPTSAPAGQGFTVKATVSATDAAVAAGTVRVDVPQGWQAVPSVQRFPALPAGESAPLEFKLWPADAGRGNQQFSLTLTAGDATGRTIGKTVQITDPTLIGCSEMGVIAYSSQETASEDRKASNLVDCATEPGWHSAWSSNSTPPPHWAVIDLGSERLVTSAGCVPRDNRNGRIKKVRFETSADGNTWTQKVESQWADTTSAKVTELDGSRARYVRMTGLESFDGQWITCGEFTATAKLGDTPAAPVISAPANGAGLAPGTVEIRGTSTPGTVVHIQDATGRIQGSSNTSDAGTWSYSAAALPEGAYSVTAVVSSRDGRLSPGATVAFNVSNVVAPNLKVAATASFKCMAGKASLVVQAANNGTTAVGVEFTSEYGSKSFANVKGSGYATHAFATRAVAPPAGTVSVRATDTVGSAPPLALTVPYAAVNCGN